MIIPSYYESRKECEDLYLSLRPGGYYKSLARRNSTKVFLCGKLGKPASLQAIFSIFYESEENTKTEDFFGGGGGGGGGGRRSTDQAIY